MDVATQLKLVRRHPTWRDAGDADVRTLLRRSTILDLPGGAIVIRDGDPALHVYFVLEGAVRVFYSPTATRGAMTIKLFGAPSSFGDAECVLGSTYAENVQAIVHSLILGVPKDVYFAYLQRDVRACYLQYREVARQFGIAIQYERSASSASERIIAVLVAYATQFGIDEDDGVLIDYTITQDMLARESDSKRRSVVRALDGLYQAGLLKRNGRNYLITSIDALLKHASTTLPNIALKSLPEPTT